MPDNPKGQGSRIQSDKIDYQELWQYFESRGSELKGTMLQVATLLIGFAAAILGYAVDKTLSFDSSPLAQKPLLLLMLASVGIAIVIYAEVVIREFGKHINLNFDRADYSRTGDRPLDEILSYSESAARSIQKLPNICITVRQIIRTFGVAFALGGLLGLVRFLCPL